MRSPGCWWSRLSSSKSSWLALLFVAAMPQTGWRTRGFPFPNKRVHRNKGWGLQEWVALYTDLPSRQLKVSVADRSVVETMNAETRVRSPAALQSAIDESVGAYCLSAVVSLEEGWRLCQCHPTA